MSPEKSRDGGFALRRHLAEWWKQYVGLLAALYLFYKIAGPLSDWLPAWLVSHETVSSGAIRLDGIITWLLVSGVLLLLALVVFAVYTTISLIKAHRQASLGKKVQILAQTFERTVQAADLIAKQLFPGSATAIKKVISYKQVFTLYKNGDCHTTEISVVTAKDKDIHFMEKSVAADQEGEPVDFPDEMDLQVTSDTPNKGVAYLLSANEPRQKDVAIFFLPRIQASAPDHRQVRITYFWKGFFKRLVTRGEEPFETTIKTVEPIPEVEYEFWTAPGAGVLTCTNVGRVIDENDPQREKLVEVERDDRGMKGWRYTASNLPSDHVSQFRLTWRES